MSKISKKRGDVKIFIEILQNGGFLAEAVHPLTKKGKIKITSSLRGSNLTLPLYPLAKDIEILEIDRKGARLNLDNTWSGFITCDGIPIDIMRGKQDSQSYLMREGDYGTVKRNDLSLLIRIGREQKPPYVARDDSYRGKILPLWIGDKTNIQILALAGIISVILLSTFLFSLLKMPDTRPRQLKDLLPDYSLAFVYPKHIETLPEALQENLSRKDYLKLTFNYYEDLVSLLLGYKSSFTLPIFASSRDNYVELYKKQRRKIGDVLKHQPTRYDSHRPAIGRGLLVIPTVHGESLPGSILRVIDKLSVAHENFELTLELRRKVTEAFNDPDDGSYDFNNYRNLNRKKSTVNPMAGIKVFNVLSNENAMYKEALDLANEARYQQLRLRSHRVKLKDVDLKEVAPISIGTELSAISIEDLVLLGGLNAKIDKISASSFGYEVKKIKEPLIGQLNPRLIESVIAKNQFSLQLCYELALRRDRDLNGKMEWQWRLDSRGTISDLNLIYTSIKDRKMAKCVRDKIATWKFPRPTRGSVEITYPFHFKPARG